MSISLSDFTLSSPYGWIIAHVGYLNHLLHIEHLVRTLNPVRSISKFNGYLEAQIYGISFLCSKVAWSH